jgi:hypothetical protein
VAPPGIDPGTVRLVAQLFNHYTTPGSNRTEYQEYFLGVKGGRCVRLTTLPLSCADCLEIWESQPPGTLRASPGLYRDCCVFTFTFYLLLYYTRRWAAYSMASYLYEGNYSSFLEEKDLSYSL